MNDKTTTCHVIGNTTVRSISGIWGRRLDDVMKNWTKQVDFEFLLDCFRSRPGSQRFIGEHFGKFLDGLLQAIQMTDYKELQKAARYLVEEFVKTQEEDGYIGTYLEDERWRGRLHHLIPIENGWDPWVFKYSILALLRYYNRSGWMPALETCKKAADLLIRVFGAGGSFDLNRSDEHWGLASGSVLEAVVLLYRNTGEKRYLDFAGHIVTYYWGKDEYMQPRILPVLQRCGELKDIGMGKAYEMISCFVGLLEYYRCTGEGEYLQVLTGARDRMAAGLKQVNGNMSDHEWFREAGNNSEKADMENCVAFSWMQFNGRLFELTGDIQCLDYIEETAWNHIIPALCPDGSTWQYYLTLTGPKKYAYWSQSAGRHKPKGAPLTCCHTNGLRALTLYPQYMYSLDNDGMLHVNLYSASRAEVLHPAAGKLLLEQRSDFPKTGEIDLLIKPENDTPFKLKIRVPEWAVRTEIDGTCHPVDALRRITVDIAGETRVHISFEMALHLILPGFINRGKYAIGYGPYVFAVDRIPEGWDMDEVALVLDAEDNFKNVRIGREGGWPYIEIMSLRIPGGVCKETGKEFPNRLPSGIVQLRPLMFAGLGDNLACSQDMTDGGAGYDQELELPQYRALFPCYFTNMRIKA